MDRNPPKYCFGLPHFSLGTALNASIIGVSVLWLSACGSAGEPGKLLSLTCTDEQKSSLTFGGGSGSLSDPYQICTIQQLANVSQDPSQSYILLADLDFREATTPNSIVVNSSFSGVFDGNHHTISHFEISETSALSSDGLGLFSELGTGGEIKNLSVLDATISKSAPSVGILAGLNRGTIVNCHSSGVIANGGIAGGLVGSMVAGSIIENSSSSVEVNGNAAAGGLVGIIAFDRGTPAQIRRSYSVGKLRQGGGGAFLGAVGGLVGIAESSLIEDSYSRADLSGKGWVGGLVGTLQDGVTVQRSYFAGSAALEIGGIGTGLGGLAGSMSGGALAQSFSAGTLSAPTPILSLVYGIVATASRDSQLRQIYWDISRAGFSSCFPTVGHPDVSECKGIRSSTQPRYFLDSTSPPFSTWDPLTWVFPGNDFPSLAMLTRR